MNLRVMVISDYEKVYSLWMSCRNMGFTAHSDVTYRNKALTELVRIDT